MSEFPPIPAGSVSKSLGVVPLERARQIVHEASPAEMPVKVYIRDLYMQLGRTYKLGGFTEKVFTMETERDRLNI